MSPTFWIKKFRDNLNKIWTWISRHNSNFDNLNINKHVNYIFDRGSRIKNEKSQLSKVTTWKVLSLFPRNISLRWIFRFRHKPNTNFKLQSKIRVILVRKPIRPHFRSYFYSKITFFTKNQMYFPQNHGHVRLEKVMSTFSYRINHQKQNFSSKITIFLVKWLILGVVCCQHWTIGVKILELKQQVLITGLNSLVL